MLFFRQKFRTDPIEFDLTACLKTILSNEVWNRKFSYGFNTGLKNTDPGNIDNARIIIYPRFFSGSVNENRLQEIIEERCGRIPGYLKINNYQEWAYRLGVAFVEVGYKADLTNIPTAEDFEPIVPNWNMDFVAVYHQQIAVAKELAALFLASLHLTFPTTSVAMSDDIRKSHVLFKNYDEYLLHEILVERSKAILIKDNLFDSFRDGIGESLGTARKIIPT